MKRRAANVKLLRAVRLLCLAFAAGLALIVPASSARIDDQFRAWLAGDLWPEAQGRGVSRETFETAFAGLRPNLKLPDLVMPGARPATPKKQHQAEFGSPGNYFGPIGTVTRGGRDRAARLSSTLSAVERRYGVPGGIVLAIWGRESGFGTAKIPYDAFEVLGTKAFLATRKEMFRAEVLAALEMIQRGLVSRKAMKSSWAGALGQPQFLPTSFLKHAVDFDGDGRADIWNSAPDTLASIANYLVGYGWVKGRDWGFEVTVPQDVSCVHEGPDRGRPISDWAALGIARVNGKPFPAGEAQAEGFLLMPAGRNGPAFIVTPNFYVLKEYNESDLYALFIGHSADRIAHGDKSFAAGWGKVTASTGRTSPHSSAGWRNSATMSAAPTACRASRHAVRLATGKPGAAMHRPVSLTGKWWRRCGNSTALRLQSPSPFPCGRAALPSSRKVRSLSSACRAASRLSPSGAGSGRS